MIRSMRVSVLAGAVAALLLSACGDRPTGPGLALVSQLASAAAAAAGVGGGAASGQNAAALDPRQSLSREMIDAAGQPLLLVVLPARNAAASMTVAGRNGNKVTWISAAGQTVTLRDGMIVATRALGDDLMGLSLPGGLNAIRSPAPHNRVYELLSGDDAITRMEVSCITQAAGSEQLDIYGRFFATRKYVETCSYSGFSFENTYWIGSDGTLRKSLQWISYGVGAVEVTVL